jgi:PPP family 3-phenylpropionic acid transporter
MKFPVRLVLFYAAALGAAGCAPYLSLYLAAGGLPDRHVPIALAVLPMGVLFGGPAWAAIADAIGSARAVLRVATLLSVLAGAALLVTTDGRWMAFVLLFWGLARAPHVAIADGLTVQILAGDRRRYGQIRLVGSVAYLGTAWVGGLLRGVYPRAPLALSLGLLAVAAGIAWTLPRPQPLPRAERASSKDILSFAWSVAPFLAVSVLHGVALVAFDNYWAFRVDKLHLGGWVAGSGVAVAVLVEVAVMGFGWRLLDRVGPQGLVAAAILCGIPEWALSSVCVAPAPLIALQALRGVAFGAFWIAGIAYLSEKAPARLATSATALLPASAYGIGFLVCSALAAAVLARGTVDDLYRAVAVVEVLALIALAATRR